MEQRRKKEGSSGSGNKGGGIARARDATYHLHKHIYIMYRIVYYTQRGWARGRNGCETKNFLPKNLRDSPSATGRKTPGLSSGSDEWQRLAPPLSFFHAARVSIFFLFFFSRHSTFVILVFIPTIKIPERVHNKQYSRAERNVTKNKKNYYLKFDLQLRIEKTASKNTLSCCNTNIRKQPLLSKTVSMKTKNSKFLIFSPLFRKHDNRSASFPKVLNSFEYIVYDRI